MVVIVRIFLILFQVVASVVAADVELFDENGMKQEYAHKNLLVCKLRLRVQN